MPGSRSRSSLDVDEPLSVGADRIVNALAAVELFRADTSWWTSAPPRRSTASRPTGAFSAASSCPGFAPRPTSSPAARPNYRPPSCAPARVIGRRTEECIQAGVLFGAADAVDGIVRRIRAEWPGGRRPGVVATGGMASRRGAALYHHRAHRPRPDAPRTSHRRRASRPGVVSTARDGRLLAVRTSLRLPAAHQARRVADHGGAHRRWGTSWRSAWPAPAPGDFCRPALLGLALWVVCLNGGTLAINSAFDRDEGDIAYLRQPPPPPRGLAGFTLALMLRGLLGALPCRPGTGCVRRLFRPLRAVLRPAFPAEGRGRSRLGDQHVGLRHADPVRGVGGDRVPVDPAPDWCCLRSALSSPRCIPLTQLYQFEEDPRRGDRTLAPRWGRSLGVALSAAPWHSPFRRGRRPRRMAVPGDGLALGALGTGGVGLGRAAASLARARHAAVGRPASARDVPSPRRVGGDRCRGRADLGDLNRPLAAPLAASRYTWDDFHRPIRRRDDPPAELHGDYDVTDVPSIVRGAVKLGLLEGVAVLLFSLASRLLSGPLETIVLAIILCRRPRRGHPAPWTLDPRAHHRGHRRRRRHRPRRDRRLPADRRQPASEHRHLHQSLV